MAGEDDELALCNDALADIGASPVFALDEDTELAEKVARTWPNVRATCLSLSAWSFATRTYPLPRRTEPPQNGWKYGYDLPGGVIGGPEIVLKGVSREHETTRAFAFEEGIIFSNHAQLWAQFRVTAAIALWPPEFRLAVKTALAGALAVPVAHDTRLAAAKKIEAHGRPEEGMRGGLIGAAIALDLAKRPRSSPILRGDPLTDARYM